MDETPPEIAMDLRFLAPDIRTEFIRLFQNCLITRGYGMEQRMDHGRALHTMRTFMKARELQIPVDPKLGEFNFDVVCRWLDYEPDEARRKIARTQTWDIIREYLDSTGPAVPMPSMDTHVDALFGLDMEKRGPVWVQFYLAASGRVPITASNIKAWVANCKALPVESERIETPELEEPEPGPAPDGEPGEIEFKDEDEGPEVSQEDVPHGAKQAVAADVTPGIKQPEGQGPTFKHPAKVAEAIETIAKACGGDNVVKRAEWREVLGDPIKIDFQDLLDWAENSPEEIRRIAALTTGNLKSGLRAAMRIVKGVIDSRTTLNFLVNRCRAEGGRLEHAYGPYRIIVTYHKERDYET